MKSTEERAWALWRTGNFRDPDHPACHNVTKDDVPKLHESDREFQEAVRSRQRYFLPELDALCQDIHGVGRLAMADGRPGPATDALLDMPRCPHPDFPLDEDDDVTPVETDAAQLKLSHLYARQAANWPDACRNKLVAGRSFEALPGLSADDTDGVWWACANNWTAAIKDITMEPGEVGVSQGASFYATLKRLSGSTLAWSFLAQNRCSVQLDQAYNTNVNWNLRLGATVNTHEVGHALGLNHQRDSDATMYPTITSASMARYGYPNETDIAAMRKLGYTPHDDYHRRRPPENRLFQPRDAGPELLAAIVLRGSQGTKREYRTSWAVQFEDAKRFLRGLLE